MKTKIKMELSTQSVQQAKKQLIKQINSFEKGCKNAIEIATNELYSRIIKNCNSYNIQNASSKISMSYDNVSNVGKIYTDDWIIIFNELGTGIKGTQDSWANKFNYTVNASGKGYQGWYYESSPSDTNKYKVYTKDGKIYAFTHGIDSRHMIYNALQSVLKEMPKIIEYSISKEVGNMY